MVYARSVVFALPLTVYVCLACCVDDALGFSCSHVYSHVRSYVSSHVRS